MTTSFTLPPAPLQTAVLFLVFNRPETTAQVFEAIRQAKPPRLYVAADGPRIGREGEADRVAKVREIATAVDWPCELKTLFREKNLGCKYAVSDAITWFFEQEEQGIILEDDCLPSQSFFWFCEILLNKYKHDTRLGMISGTKSCNAEFEGKSYYSFSRLVQIWGWATWRRAWQGYDVDIKNWKEFESLRGLKNTGLSPHICSYLAEVFEKTHQNKINTWDYQWSYKCITEGLLTIFPKKNLILNIGFGPDATHTTYASTSGNALEEIEIFDHPLVHPSFIIPNKSYDDAKITKKTKLRITVGRLYEKIKSK
jgi:hypothetical protein